ncbi:MAG: archease [Burkholderiales bacterium]|nr:MAG: archease [Burkholderiales bacterium]
MKGWEHFHHEADVGVRGFGATPAEAFEQTAVALTATVTDPERVDALQAVGIECAGQDLELLLVDWLNALISEMAVRRMLFSRFEVALDTGGLRAKAWGERISRARHQPAVEVKGATFTELAVGRLPDGRWRAQCVVDV